MAGCYGHGIKNSGSMKCGKLLDREIIDFLRRTLLHEAS
jgi:hypothetical protein